MGSDDKLETQKDEDEDEKSNGCGGMCDFEWEKKFRTKLEEFMRTGPGKHMHPIFALLMLISAFSYVVLSVTNNMDGIYENRIFTLFEIGICVLFMIGWILEFYKAPNKKSYLKNHKSLNQKIYKKRHKSLKK